MRVIMGIIADVRNFFVNVPFYSSAQRRVKLSQVADFHVFVMLSEAEASLIAAARCSEKVRDSSTPLGMTRKGDDCATRNQECDSSSLRYFSASMAAAQPEPAAVTACL